MLPRVAASSSLMVHWIVAMGIAERNDNRIFHESFVLCMLMRICEDVVLGIYVDFGNEN